MSNLHFVALNIQSKEVQVKIEKNRKSISVKVYNQDIYDYKYKGFSSRFKPLVTLVKSKSLIRLCKRLPSSETRFFKQMKLRLTYDRKRKYAKEKRKDLSINNMGMYCLQWDWVTGDHRQDEFYITWSYTFCSGSVKCCNTENQELFKINKWKVLKHPSQSPDLNPNENASHLLKTKPRPECSKQAATAVKA